MRQLPLFGVLGLFSFGSDRCGFPVFFGCESLDYAVDPVANELAGFLSGCVGEEPVVHLFHFRIEIDAGVGFTQLGDKRLISEFSRPWLLGGGNLVPRLIVLLSTVGGS